VTFQTWGEPYLTADASNQRVFSPFKFTKNVLVSGFRYRIIFNNDPTLTSIGGRIFSDNGSTAPSALIASSTDTRPKSELNTLGNGIAESFVLFNDVPLRKDTTYHFLLTLNGYTGTSSSHVAWEKAYPDPVAAPPGHDFNAIKTDPFFCYAIFAEL